MINRYIFTPLALINVLEPLFTLVQSSYITCRLEDQIICWWELKFKIYNVFSKVGSHYEWTFKKSKKEGNICALPKDMQTEMIKIICSVVLQINTFLLLQAVPDIAHMEQMSIVIHFVDTTSSKVTINEHLLRFLDICTKLYWRKYSKL